MASRRQFIESQGATCKNWAWSWSFVNHEDKFVIFGAWDANTEGSRVLILEDSWALSPKGARQRGYSQSREHIRLVEEGGYALRTFPMQYGTSDPDDPDAPAKILGFTPELSDKSLVRIGSAWYASDGKTALRLPQELDETEALKEGAAVSVKVNTYERNAKARDLCLAHHGRTCAVCGFDFEEVYGPVATSGIHVHHIVPVAEIGREYIVDPVKDLVPVCPNCHAVIHCTRPALSVEQLKAHLEERADEVGSAPVTRI